MSLTERWPDKQDECDYEPVCMGSVSNRSKFRGQFRVRFHPKPDRGNGSYHTKNPAHWKWAGFPPKTRHFKFTSLAPVKYLSSDRIMTWSVRRLCSFSCSFTSRCPICDQTSIRWVAIENPPISGKISLNFTAIRRILVLSQIWPREVTEQLKLHNLRTDHVMIRSQFKYLIGVKFGGIWRNSEMDLRSGYNPAKKPRVCVRSGSQTRQDQAVRVFGRVTTRTEPNRRPKTGPLVGYPDPLLTLATAATWSYDCPFIRQFRPDTSYKPSGRQEGMASMFESRKHRLDD